MKIEELVFNPRGPAVNDRQILRAEKRLGVVFPGDYRRFLKLHNGGRADCLSSDEKLDIRYWLSVYTAKTKPTRCLITANELARDSKWGSVILIGWTAADLHIVMRTESEKRAQIGLFDWGVMEINEVKMRYESFTEFVEDLHPYDWELD